MLPDVRMVQMYSRSANVNDLGCVERLAPLFAWTSPPPCSYGFSAMQVVLPYNIMYFTVYFHSTTCTHNIVLIYATFACCNWKCVS